MGKLYRCKVCSLLFNTFEEVEFHLEHTDDIHALWLEQKGLWECIEEVEPEKLYKGCKYPDYKYPSYGVPKDFNIKVTENIYANKGATRFFDTVSKKEYSEDQLIKFLKENDRLDELREFLKWKAKLHLKRIAKLTGVNIRDSDLERMSEEELLGLMFREYLTHGDKRVRLGQYAEEGLRKTIEFLSGNTDICPYCHMHRDTFFLGHEYERKKILEQLNVVNTKAYRKFIKGYKEAKKEGKPLPQPNEMRKLLNSLGFNCTFYGKPVFVSLNTMIHLALDHSERLKKMLNSGTLVPKNKAVKSYFLSEKWKQEPKRSKQELSDVLKVPSVEEKLCPKEKALIEWFKKGN